VETWSVPQLVFALVVASAVSMGTFAHAERHGSSHATAWGVGAFLAAAIVVPIYFVRYWLRKRSSA
jgi:NhaP-type Na+/H+ or K+/H+ antiporter